MPTTNEQVLISVKDEQGTLLRPVEATFAVEYKYKDEATAEVVMEGDVRRGMVLRATDFPAASAEKDLEFSEIKVTPKAAPFEFYSAKIRRFNLQIPVKDSEKEGVDMKLDFTGIKKPSKEQIRATLADAAQTKLHAIQAKAKGKTA